MNITETLPPDDTPLSGLRILDMTTVIFGPYAAQTLGDYGADVIKIESPSGDTSRQIGPMVSPAMGAFFMGSNRNKRSVVLDIKEAEGRAALTALIARADVFMHNTRPHKLELLGLGPETLLAHNPRLIYAGLHGFREGGPYAGLPAYDDIVQAGAGVADVMARHLGEPRYVPTVIADKTSALTAVNAILAALMRRDRTGKGCFVEVPMFESMVANLLVEHWSGKQFVPALGETGYARVLVSWRKPIATSDGYVCVLPYTDDNWYRFWNEVGEPSMCSDPRFRTLPDRLNHYALLYEILSQHVATMSSEDCLAMCRRLDIPCGPVTSLEELDSDPQLKATGFFRTVQHPTEGTLCLPDVPVRFDGKSLEIKPQPGLGQHTASVLREIGIENAKAS